MYRMSEVANAGWFVHTVEGVTRAARGAGLVVPGFRSPPRTAGLRRTIGRPADGGVVVAVATAGRTPYEIVCDLVEGVVVANGLRGAAAEATRQLLLRSLDDTGPQPARAA
jgi:hypothetical protein